MVSQASLANAIRVLAMDSRPGRPTPATRVPRWAWPKWPSRCGIATSATTRPIRSGLNRDRFVLSNGHGSMLLYSLLHLTGYDLPTRRPEELPPAAAARRRATPSTATPPGVETTTGPLGQGIANAVGLALAEKLLAAEFNRDGHAIVDHRTYAFLGDGCLMEGI